MKKKFKVNLKKEVYKKQTEEGFYIHPTREYIVEYYDELYHLDIDDKIIGNTGGSYKAKLCFIKSNVDRKQKEIYSYEYKEKIAKENYNKNYKDVIDYLLNNNFIKKIVIKKQDELQ